MTTFRNLLGATALGVGLMFGGFTAQEAKALSCSDPSADCGTFVGTGGISNPNASGILSFVSALTNISTDLLVLVGKVNETGADPVGSVTVTGDGGSGSIANELLQGKWSATSAVNYIVLRDGAGDQGSALYRYDPAQTSGTWSMEATRNSGGQVGALSTLGAVQVVPVPAALPLLLTALGALGLIGRKKMMAA